MGRRMVWVRTRCGERQEREPEGPESAWKSAAVVGRESLWEVPEGGRRYGMGRLPGVTAGDLS